MMRAKVKPRINLEGRTPLQDVVPLATPMVVFVDPASVCNFKCEFCPTGHHDLIAATGRFVGFMGYDLFQKIVDDLAEFPDPIRVLRLYKDGEPFMNRLLPAMVEYAKKSGRVEYVDTTTNGSLISRERLLPVLEAGIDRINVSVEGVDAETYERVAKVRRFDFGQLVERVRWLYDNRGQCEVAVKVVGDYLSEEQRQKFFDAFGDICDRIFVENLAPCWPNFDTEARTGHKITRGIYQQDVGGTDVCPYVLYSYSVNADGLVSACFIDWGRKLIVGDARTQSMRSIWDGDEMNKMRLMHLRGERRSHPVCGSCGQLSHCLPDNVDQYRDVIRARFLNKDQFFNEEAAT